MELETTKESEPEPIQEPPVQAPPAAPSTNGTRFVGFVLVLEILLGLDVRLHSVLLLLMFTYIVIM